MFINKNKTNVSKITQIRKKIFFSPKIYNLLRPYLPAVYELYVKSLWNKYLDEETGRIYFSKVPKELNVVYIGKKTYSSSVINVNHVSKTTNIYIGSYTSIGLNLKLITSGGHSTSHFTTFPFNAKTYEKGDVTIGNDVWIGDDVTIFGGVEISDGSIIGTGSIVTKSVEPYSIYAGVPAKFIRYRFSDEIRMRLRNLSWWNLSDDLVAKISYLLVNGETTKDIDELESLVINVLKNKSESLENINKQTDNTFPMVMRKDTP